MKLADRPRRNLLYKYDEIVIPIKKGQIHQINECLDRIGEIDSEAEYTVKIEKKRRRRSLDANAYCWTLVGKLAEVLQSTSEEVYRECIKKYGVSDIRPVEKTVSEELCRMWDSQGIGNSHIAIGDSKVKGYVNIRFFWGSSKYDTANMSRLIDGIISECKEQGIETMPPEELERLKQQWGGTECKGG